MDKAVSEKYPRPLVSMILMLVIIWLVPIGADGAKLYTYKDKNGRTVFTDQKPPEEIQYQQEQLLVTEGRRKVHVVNRGSREKPRLYIVNDYSGPAQVSLFFNKADNIQFSHRGPFSWVLPAGADRQVLTLQPKVRNRKWSYSYRSKYVPGAPVRGKVVNYEYQLPFREGSFRISQGFRGPRSHGRSRQSYYAIDIAMPELTPVVAARAGIIMDSEGDFSRSGWHQDYMDEANIVRVLHSDGTMAVYAHLAPDGILVKKGARVNQGELLAYSGNTGFSSGPHLHFVVQKNNGRELVSIPFRFQGDNELKKGVYLTSTLAPPELRRRPSVVIGKGSNNE
ncbi:M23 family metallopeptidase [Pseudomaricurvus alkylphenolicus]|uniref:peptidoglycan DD-metalloendopeptidase family protein n=1 Tax=Pseudomaricurvus alkylphenolicus TaxID=1306991 RepID=UPI00141F59BA|nr:M23 family metallopeptidase [Pseudomaricurvus alkylphenolicus]NIB39084.1 M23 family metallopeptidase [Pseudomaricurvus alkylphenolicus]